MEVSDALEDKLSYVLLWHYNYNEQAAIFRMIFDENMDLNTFKNNLEKIQKQQDKETDDEAYIEWLDNL